ncbi:MAG: DUF177 domain-containing protein [Acidimicrobiaceae bacterium]|nr:DUF177 domain-containing protein [Acidimicrobiaceae bacterium]
MTRGAQFVVDTAGLFSGAEQRLVLRTEAKLADMELSDSGLRSTVVDGRLRLDLVLERTGSAPDADDASAHDSRRTEPDGVLVSGTARGRWSVPCRRCSEPMQGDLAAEIQELFEVAPTEGETWALREALQEDGIDLGPMLREVALVCLPLAPLCRTECEGPAPDRFPTGPPVDEDPRVDPRWSVLDELTFDA